MPDDDDPPPLNLGWLDGTRTLPAPTPTPLPHVSARGVLELQAELAELADARAAGTLPAKRRRPRDALGGGNAGVAARAARDQAAAAAETRATTTTLQRKAELYDAMAAGRVAPAADGLVDFGGRQSVGGDYPPPSHAAAAPGLGYDNGDADRAARVAAAANDAADTAAAREAEVVARAAAAATTAARRAALRRRFVRSKVEELSASGADVDTAP